MLRYSLWILDSLPFRVVLKILLGHLLIYGKFYEDWQMKTKCENIGNATLYLGDCFSVLPKLDVQADAIISDPYTLRQEVRSPKSRVVW